MCYIITVPVSDAVFDQVTDYLDSSSIRFSLSEERSGALDIEVLTGDDARTIKHRIGLIESSHSKAR